MKGGFLPGEWSRRVVLESATRLSSFQSARAADS